MPLISILFNHLFTVKLQGTEVSHDSQIHTTRNNFFSLINHTDMSCVSIAEGGGIEKNVKKIFMQTRRSSKEIKEIGNYYIVLLGYH